MAEHWGRALRTLGFDVVTVAGEGPVDRTVPGLGLADPPPPGDEQSLDTATAALADPLADAIAGIDLVVVENLLSIPMNLAASRATIAALAGRPAVLHHHDPPWQRAEYLHVTELPPTDPAWRHVTINELTRAQFADRGLDAVTIYNGFDTTTGPGDRAGTRALLGVAEDELLVCHPVRAIPRKQIPDAVALCEEIGATYWLLGPAEFGYADELDRILTRARCRVIHRPLPHRADIYAASDAVVFPSSWEGFGNPPIEAAIHHRPVAVGPYPVGAELRRLGFCWCDTDDPDSLRAFLARPGAVRAAALEHNHRLVERHFSLPVMTERIRALLDEAGWLP